MRREDCDGFTLMEVIVTVGIFSLLALMAGTFGNFYAARFRQMENAVAVDLAVNDIRLVFSQPNQCRANLIDTPVTASGALLPSKSIGQFDPSLIGPKSALPYPPPTRVLAHLNAQVSNVIFDDMTLTPVGKISPSLTAVRLTLKVRLPSFIPAGALTRTIDLLSIVGATGNVTDCWVQQDTGKLISNQVCKVSSNGALDTYDPATSNCVLSNGKWYDGTEMAATCPAGTKVTATATYQSNCRDSGSGIADPRPPTMFPMTTGPALNASRGTLWITVDIPSSTCSCSPASDLPPALFASTVCSVLCVPGP